MLALVAALASVLATGGAGARAAGAEPAMIEVARLAIDSPENRNQAKAETFDVNDVKLAVNSRSRRGFMSIKLMPEGGVPQRFLIRTFDLDSLRTLGEVSIASELSPVSSSRVVQDAGGQRFLVFDEEYEVLDLPGIGKFPTRASQMPNLVIRVLDQRRLAAGVDPVVARIRPPASQATLLRARRVVSSTLTRTSDGLKLFVYFSAPPAGPLVHYNVPLVTMWDVDDALAAAQRGQPGVWEPDGSWELDGCADGLDVSNPPVMFGESRGVLYTICSVQKSFGGQPTIAVVRVGADGRQVYFPGPIGMRRAWADGHSKRILIASQGTGGAGERLWAFDALLDRYVGAAGTTLADLSQVSYGFSEQDGRYYMLVNDHLVGGQSEGVNSKQVAVQGGLLIVDARLTPVAQPVSFPEWSYVGDGAIVVDEPGGGKPRRLFVRRATGVEARPGGDPRLYADDVYRYPDGKLISLVDEQFYRVIEDRVPDAAQPSLADLDRLTLDVPERQGVTDIDYEAGASAYGFRSRFVGGYAAAVRLPGESEIIESTLLSQGYTPPCGYPDRDQFFGWVERSRLSGDSKSATAHGLDVDQASKADLERPTERCSPRRAGEPPRQDGVKWSDHFAAAECAPGEDDVATAKELAAGVGRFEAAAKCPSGEERVTATAAAHPVGAGVSVADATSDIVIARDPKLGVVATATAEARGITLGEVTIDRVTMVARAWSNGRPGKERATVTRTICGVRGGPFAESGCLAERDAEEFVEQFNEHFGTNLEIALPKPDAGYLAGSPGGYIAGVTKPRPDELNDQLLNRDYQQEVPGLEVVGYRDSSYFGAGRQIYQFAAVRAVATFAVQCVPPYTFARAGAPCKPFVLSEEYLPPDNSVDTNGEKAPGPPEPKGPTEKVIDIVRKVTGSVAAWTLRSVGEGLLSGGVWIFLGLPAVLAARRQTLGRYAKG